MFTVIAEFKDGTAAYLRQREKTRDTARDAFDQKYTTLRRWARRHTSAAAADEEASRLNGVAALGQCWKEVAYFRPAPVSTRRVSR